MAEFKAVIVGAGSMGRAWGKNLRANATVEVVGWVDIRPGAAQQAIAEVSLEHAQPSERLDQALAAHRPDFVVDVTVPEAHHDVTLEALAAGVPVVATACPGGSEELLAGGKGGILVPMDDAQATADAILQLMDRPREAAALKKLVSRYTVEASAAAYLKTLDRAVSSNLAREAGTKS
jgi:glycosyltransferase involved in cell wall biosynthesis